MKLCRCYEKVVMNHATVDYWEIYPGNSLIHQLDPRTKSLIVFLYVFVVFLANNAISYGFLFLYALIALFFAKVPIRYVLSGLKPILWIFLLHFSCIFLQIRRGCTIPAWLVFDI